MSMFIYYDTHHAHAWQALLQARLEEVDDLCRVVVARPFSSVI